MKQNILYLALNFPKVGTGNNLYTDLMEEFRDRGHNVYIIASALETGTPGYSMEAGMHVIRAKVPEHQNVGNIRKGISNVLLPFAYERAFKKYFPKDVNIDLIVMPTPPITLTRLAYKLKREFKAKVYLILRDIFPQNAVDLGFMGENGLLHRYFRNVEKKLYSTSDFIGCMSQGNIDYVMQHNVEVSKSKLHLLRNWQRKHDFSGVHKQDLKAEFNLEGKTVLFFGGNIGKPQKVENLVNLALLFKDNPNVCFYIVGKGTEAPKLKDLVARNNLEQVVIKDFLPREDYFKVMQMADIGLISLDERFTIPNVPSKALSYFNAKIPIIAIIDSVTDFGTWIQDDVKAGYWQTKNNLNNLVKHIDTILNNPEHAKTLGENGYSYFCENLLVEQAYLTIIKQTANEVL